MSQNTPALMTEEPSSVHAGLDIAKASLQLHLQSKSFDLPNTPLGHVQLLKRLAAIPGVHIICEATGGYERAVVAALHAATIPVSVINPARVRQFARASGELAKTDPIDARVLTDYGAAVRPGRTPAPTPPPARGEARAPRRRPQLEHRVAERNRRYPYTAGSCRRAGRR